MDLLLLLLLLLILLVLIGSYVTMYHRRHPCRGSGSVLCIEDQGGFITGMLGMRRPWLAASNLSIVVQ